MCDVLGEGAGRVGVVDDKRSRWNVVVGSDGGVREPSMPPATEVGDDGLGRVDGDPGASSGAEVASGLNVSGRGRLCVLRPPIHPAVERAVAVIPMLLAGGPIRLGTVAALSTFPRVAWPTCSAPTWRSHCVLRALAASASSQRRVH